MHPRPLQFTRPFSLERIQEQFQTDPQKIQASTVSSSTFQQKRTKIIQQMKKKFQRQIRKIQLEKKKIQWDKKWLDFMQSFCSLHGSSLPETEDDLIEAVKTCLPKSRKIISLFTYDRIITLCIEALKLYSPAIFNEKLQTRVLKKILSTQPYNYYFFSAVKNKFYSLILENVAHQDRPFMQKDLREKTISPSKFLTELVTNMDATDAAELENEVDFFLKVIQLIFPGVRNLEDMLALF